MEISKDRYITNVGIKKEEIKSIRLLYSKKKKLLSQWYAETGANVLIPCALITNKTGVPIEYYQTDGKVLSVSSWCKRGFGINWDGSVMFGDYNPNYRDFTVGFPMLVQNCKKDVNFGVSQDIANINPRTVFSQTPGGILITTVDGRQMGKLGMTISQLSAYMASLNVLHSANLDGGGATHLKVNGETINSPCEDRALSNVLAIWLNKTDNKEDTKVAKKICIDAGHNYSRFDTGAEGNGIREQDVTFEIAQQVGELLVGVGFDVKLTRNNLKDNLGSKTMQSSCNARAEIANNFKADLFISVHCNAFYDNEAHGTECHVYKVGNAASGLALKIVDSIVGKVGTTKRGTPLVANPKLIVLRETNMPAILVETAFISNFEDATKLKDGNADFARAIATTVAEHYGVALAVGKEVSPVSNKYSYDDTVDNMVADGITTTENMAYWEKMLDGREAVNPEFLRVVLDKYHKKLSGENK